jgi:LPPG:FO 2-phospho-L-lactate transferase
VLALCGGIGGAKLALGLARTLGRGELTVLVNTGDDFDHLGLRISPDIDTVLYTLGGVADPERGWGRADETWNFMSAVRQMGGETWFQLGDRDLAMHVARTRYLRAGGILTDFVEDAARRLGIDARILPMTDDDVQTIVETDAGTLEFQRYFVEQRCRPEVRSLWFAGASRTRVSAAVSRAIFDARAIIICPSNPYLSIDPILAIPGVRTALLQTTAPIVAVSPIIGGAAVKGPTARSWRSSARRSATSRLRRTITD